LSAGKFRKDGRCGGIKIALDLPPLSPTPWYRRLWWFVTRWPRRWYWRRRRAVSDREWARKFKKVLDEHPEMLDKITKPHALLQAVWDQQEGEG